MVADVSKSINEREAFDGKVFGGLREMGDKPFCVIQAPAGASMGLIERQGQERTDSDPDTHRNRVWEQIRSGMRDLSQVHDRWTRFDLRTSFWFCVVAEPVGDSPRFLLGGPGTDTWGAE